MQFATPNGLPAFVDTRLVKTAFSLLTPLLMTRKADLQQYHAMTQSKEFNNLIAYADVIVEQFLRVIVPGRHAQGMRSMLESTVATQIILHFFKANKPVAAVCHRVLLLARTIDPSSRKSVLF